MRATVYLIHTPRLVVRCWNPSDAPLLKAAKNANAVTNREQPSVLVRLAGQDWLGPYLTWFEAALQRILEDKAPADVALTEAQKKADAYRVCLINNDALRAVGVYKACLRQVDPRAAGN